MNRRQLSLFESGRLRFDDAIDLSLKSLDSYGSRYRHWAVAYSGGKDSSATVTFVAWAIKSGMVKVPESLTVLYADTRMEIPPLRQTAVRLLENLSDDGFRTAVVLPEIDNRFFVYMLGRGVPPPKNTFRWCTSMLKIKPMMKALLELRKISGEKIMMITGVRIGESAARDQRIALSCSRDTGECGQGWFQISTPEAIADTLAPLLHWRLCHVYDWIYFSQDKHGYDVSDIAVIYGEGDVRTGCIECNLASRDVSLERLIRNPEWQYLKPLLELKPLYKELKLAFWRKRKTKPEICKSGKISKNIQRMGPLTMEGRSYGLEKVLDIQRRAKIDLINDEEEERIREMWAYDVWPEKWSKEDIDAIFPFDFIQLEDGKFIVQPLLIR